MACFLASVLPVRRTCRALELPGSTRVWLFRNGTLGTVGMYSNTDLEDFFENGDFALHIVGSDGTILRANRAELELLGYSAEEYVGHHIAEFHADAAVIDDML